jgi:hypothetical protein
MRLDVGGYLAIGGPFEGALADAHIAGNAAVDGRIALASLSVGGELVQPAGNDRSITGTSQIHAQRSAPVQVDAPCACGAAQGIDVAALVRDAAAHATMLPGTTAVMARRCAQFALAGSAPRTVQITVRESAALYVSGDFQVRGDLLVDADPGAELDLFIAGNAAVDGVVALGSQPGQGAVRVFAGGNGTIQLSSGGSLHGVLYAPRAELVLSGAFDATGALFVRRVAGAADLTVHYDRSLARP